MAVGDQLLMVATDEQMAEAGASAKSPNSDVSQHHSFDLDLISHVFSPQAFRKAPSKRQQVNHFLHSPLGQAIIVAFVILDCLVVFAQLYVDLQKEKLELKHLELICHGNNTEEAESLESSIHSYEVAFEALHYTSMALISLFFVEVLLKMITGWHHFFSSILEVIDGCIVIISFGLDVLLMIEEVSVIIESLAQLLILLRLWRIARIVNGAAVAMDSKWRTKYHALEDRMKAIYDALPPDIRDEIPQFKHKEDKKAHSS